MKTKHTPGNWTVNTCKKDSWNSVGLIIYAPDGSAIAMSGGYNSEECQANAKLIASAPDLLNALIEITETFKACLGGSDPLHFEDFKDEIKLAESAIKKAIDEIPRT